MVAVRVVFREKTVSCHVEKNISCSILEDPKCFAVCQCLMYSAVSFSVVLLPEGALKKNYIVLDGRG